LVWVHIAAHSSPLVKAFFPHVQRPRTVAFGIGLLCLLQPASAVVVSSSHTPHGLSALGTLAQAAAAITGATVGTALVAGSRPLRNRTVPPPPPPPPPVVDDKAETSVEGVLKDEDPLGFVGQNP
jgi:hypothetical protein